MVITVGKAPNEAERIRRRQGNLIRKFRKAREISIDELAKAIDVTPGAVSQWETGRFSPRAAMQVKIAKALDAPWSVIFGLDGEAA